MPFKKSRLPIAAVILVLGITAFPGSLLRAQQSAGSNDVTDLIERLQSDSYSERQAASRQLEQAGVEIVGDLVDQMLSGPPESAARCTSLLSAIALRCDESDMTRIARVMSVLADNGFPHLRDEALTLNAKWKNAQVDRLVQELESEGFQIQRLGDFSSEAALLTMLAEIAPDSRVPGSEVPPAAGSQLDETQVFEEVSEILAASDQENEAAYQSEVAETAAMPNPVQTDNPFADSGVVVMSEPGGRIVRIDGDLAVEADVIMLGGFSGSSASSASFMITLEGDQEISADAIQKLNLLPMINQFTIRNRSVAAEFWEDLQGVQGIYQIVLENCQYDLAATFEFMKQRPNVSLTATGHETFLGVQMQNVVYEDNQTRCSILEVVADSAAEAAGLLAEDVIVSMNEVPILTHGHLVLAIGSFRPGDEVTLRIARMVDGEQDEFDVTLKLRTR